MSESAAPLPRVAVFTPRGRTAELVAQVVEERGAFAERLDGPEALLRHLAAVFRGEARCDALVFTVEDIGSADGLLDLTRTLRTQPQWSALSAFAMAEDLEVFEHALGAQLVAVAGVRPVLRPVMRAWFTAQLEYALEERAGQYRVRDHMAQLSAEQAAAEARAADLERGTRTLAHDLKTPLNALMLALEYLQAGADESTRSMLQRARRTANQMNELTEELLAYARLSAGGEGDRERELVPLGPLVERTAAQLPGNHDGSAARVDVEGLPVVWGHEVLLRQVVRNLLLNAIRYCDAAAPHIRVWSERETDRHVIRFADNGRGVAPEDRDQIFEPFIRRAPEVPGTGLGLSLCRDAMVRQGGAIWLESSGPDGSTFAIALPRK